MVLGAQPWAAVELLGPSSYHVLIGRHFQCVRARRESPIQKIYGDDVQLVTLILWQKTKRKTGGQQITALRKTWLSVFYF
jgi:hypothetical protein